MRSTLHCSYPPALVPATPIPAPSLLQSHTKRTPTSGPLPWLRLLPGIPGPTTHALPSFGPLLKCHLPNEAIPDPLPKTGHPHTNSTNSPAIQSYFLLLSFFTALITTQHFNYFTVLFNISPPYSQDIRPLRAYFCLFRSLMHAEHPEQGLASSRCSINM